MFYLFKTKFGFGEVEYVLWAFDRFLTWFWVSVYFYKFSIAVICRAFLFPIPLIDNNSCSDALINSLVVGKQSNNS